MIRLKLVAILSLLMTNSVLASVVIAPTRVIMENGTRSEKVYLVNQGTTGMAYRIDFTNYRMMEDGTIKEVEESLPGENFADAFLRFSPRRVFLEPGANQAIRISARSRGLEPGEYRSHLRVKGIPEEAIRKPDKKTEEEKGISIKLTAIRSVTIPVIVRVGMTDVDAGIRSIDFSENEEKGNYDVNVELTRSGERSVYGNLHIYVEGEDEPVHTRYGIAIYSPNTDRICQFSMSEEIYRKIEGKKIKIRYESSEEKRPGLLAEYSTTVS